MGVNGRTHLVTETLQSNKQQKHIYFIEYEIYICTCSYIRYYIPNNIFNFHLCFSEINIQTSRDILTQILETIEQTVAEQNVLSTNCETKINQTIASCTSCTKDICTPYVT